MADLERLVAEVAVPKGIGQLTDSDLVEELQARGHRVELSPPAGEGKIRIEQTISETHTSVFAVVSDTHLGSRHQQLTYLHDFYGYAKDRGASFVLHSGDLVDGPTQMHLDIIYEQFVHGYDAQVDYAQSAYPDVGLTTYAIMGNHDQSFLKNAGGNPVAELARRRPDIVHVGDLGAMVEVEGMTAYLWHPPGGNAYARSYKLQKFIEQYERGSKPNFVFAGHFHTSGHLPNYQNVSAFNVPCFQAQTPFIRRLGLNPDVGGVVIEVGWEEVDGVLMPARHKTDWKIYRRPIENDY